MMLSIATGSILPLMSGLQEELISWELLEPFRHRTLSGTIRSFIITASNLHFGATLMSFVEPITSKPPTIPTESGKRLSLLVEEKSLAVHFEKRISFPIDLPIAEVFFFF